MYSRSFSVFFCILIQLLSTSLCKPTYIHINSCNLIHFSCDIHLRIWLTWTTLCRRKLCILYFSLLNYNLSIRKTFNCKIIYDRADNFAYHQKVVVIDARIIIILLFYMNECVRVIALLCEFVYICLCVWRACVAIALLDQCPKPQLLFIVLQIRKKNIIWG